MELNGSKLWDRIYLLTLLFVGLKLAGEIDWAWWWVFSPVWIMVLLGAFFLVLGFFLGVAINVKQARQPENHTLSHRSSLMARVIRKEEEESF